MRNNEMTNLNCSKIDMHPVPSDVSECKPSEFLLGTKLSSKSQEQPVSCRGLKWLFCFIYAFFSFTFYVHLIFHNNRRANL